MKNRVLYSTLITRRRGKFLCPPGAGAGRFSGESRVKSDKPETGGNGETKIR